MKGCMTHSASLGDDSGGNITRINNAFDKIPQRLTSVEAQLENLYNQQENARAELGKPFQREQELTERTARLAELDTMLNIDGKPEVIVIGGADDEVADTDEAAAKSVPMSAKTRPSLLATLERNAEKSRAMFGGTGLLKREEAVI